MSVPFYHRLLREFTVQEVSRKRSRRKLRVFDFDDTLVTTDAAVRVRKATGERLRLTPGQFALYQKESEDIMDYGDFETLKNPRKILWTNRIIESLYAKYGPSGFVILTARGEHGPVEKFLIDAGLPGVEVVALGSSDPKAKARWVSMKIETEDLDYVEFFDDSVKNIAAVAAIRPDHPNTDIVVRHIRSSQ